MAFTISPVKERFRVRIFYIIFSFNAKFKLKIAYIYTKIVRQYMPDYQIYL
nr:MAG TPA: hypothetical protein [Crassvirales sp.]